MANVHFQSNSNEWSTLQDLFNKLNAEFGFTLDAAATDENAKCTAYFTQQDNGLTQSWGNHRVFCNPPYGREIGKWIAKAATETNQLTVMLIPARTDTKAWHKYIFGKAEIRFIEGRLRFNDSKGNAPFPSAIVIFRNNATSAKFGGTVTYEYKGSLRSVELKWFDSREEYVDEMARWLVDSPDFQPKRWWQFWRTQVCSADVLQRYSDIAG